MRKHPAPAPIYYPWRDLARQWPHVMLEHTDELPPGHLADTNGVDEIRMRRRLLQVERRCSLTHELIHLEHGHTGTCSPATEAAVDEEAARRLIPWGQLLAAVRWARSEEELAVSSG
ncbi:ImmA/IrrE family metallo-endopeptidase [Brachybacterium paraconglomeratum]|uniref:ImmA/IrrE family metallo-endopeptidase n=1 Tax=Brachybacterium paraconglomeratum TaxID=173362 RepID=UPI003F7B9C3C